MNHRLKNQYRRIFLATSFSCLSFFAQSQTAADMQLTPQAPEVNAKGYILIDYHTGKYWRKAMPTSYWPLPV